MSDTRRCAAWLDTVSRSQGFWKLQKNGRFWSVSSAVIHVIKRLTVNYDASNQYLNFNQTGFWYLSSFSVTWLSNFRCSTFGKRILSLTVSWAAAAVLYTLDFIFYIMQSHLSCVGSLAVYRVTAAGVYSPNTATYRAAGMTHAARPLQHGSATSIGYQWPRSSGNASRTDQRLSGHRPPCRPVLLSSCHAQPKKPKLHRLETWDRVAARLEKLGI